MNPLWDYFWPVFGFALLVGLLGGLMAFRRKRGWIFAAAALLALAGAGLWHGPLGAADRFTNVVETSAKRTLTDWEMTQVQGRLHHGPLTRHLMLTGPADDFQRSQLVIILNQLPGVSRATWSNSAGIPLIAEAAIAAGVGFLIGLLLAYLAELRRRYNAEWKW